MLRPPTHRDNATTTLTADHNGGTTTPVTVSFSGTDATSGPVSCDANVTFNAPDGTGKSVSGSCPDAAGNTAYDVLSRASSTTTPTRQRLERLWRVPDHNGWYNASVGYSFNGTDATSGIDG